MLISDLDASQSWNATRRFCFPLSILPSYIVNAPRQHITLNSGFRKEKKETGPVLLGKYIGREFSSLCQHSRYRHPFVSQCWTPTGLGGDHFHGIAYFPIEGNVCSTQDRRPEQLLYFLNSLDIPRQMDSLLTSLK